MRPATRLAPQNSEQLGFFHLLLRSSGAVSREYGYEYQERRIRVVNGAGTIMSTLRGAFLEAPATQRADITVAVGAMDLGVPENVVREGRPGSIVRPAAAGQWMDFQSARQLLQI